jgi:alkylation response protein AidB-like acyl-CoA dehydrogenase
MPPESQSTDDFRNEVRSFLDDNCPAALRKPIEGEARPEATQADYDRWKKVMVERGYTVPAWPREYGGGGLSKAEARVLQEEMAAIGTYVPGVSFFGVTMLGPVLLEFGNEEQKKEHLTKIANGEIQWCQGYSEPGAGSDLAGLQTRAVRDGDQYIINGSKIWTTNAHHSDWMFCLVRTDPAAPKHDGISFILFDLHAEGVTVSPIPLISGQSDFCQVFFQDVRAEARNLVGPLNGGWTIAKRLLQHERAMLSGGMPGVGGGPAPKKKKKKGAAAVHTPRSALAELARPRVGETDGRLNDAALRDRIAQYELDAMCFGLSLRRSGESAKAGQGPSAATSMFKLYMSEMNKRRAEITISALGADGLGWSGDEFDATDLANTRGWLRSKGNSIEGGTSEVQRNVIAKRVLSLPD